MYVILGLAVMLQAAAAFLSWRLMRITGKRLAWVAISTALVLMCMRRSISFFYYEPARVTDMAQLSEEWVALAVSLLMFVGIWAIRPLFQSIRDSESMLQREIQERKQAQESIAVEKERFEALAEHAPFGLVMIAGDGTFEYVNTKFRELFGYDLQDIPHGRDWFRKAYPDAEYRHEVIGTWLEDSGTSAGGPPRARVFEVTCKDGTAKVVHFRPVQLPSGRNIVSCEDITQLRQAEEAVKKSEHMLRAILAASPAAITFLENGVVKWTNPAMLKMFGVETEDGCLGKRACEFYSSESEYRRVLHLFRESGYARDGFEIEARFRRSDGSFFHGELKVSPLENMSRARGLISAIVDISERVSAQNDLRTGEERYKRLYEESKRQYELYRSLLDSSADAVVIYDMQGLTQYVNDSFTRMFGWTIDEVREQRIPFVPDSERDASMKLINRLVEEGIPCSGFETRRLTKDGRSLEVSVSASRYHDHEGNPAGMLVVLSDISQRKLLEEQLRQSAKMQAVGELAGGMAHDFNNILTAIIGYADLLSSSLPAVEPHADKVLQITRAAEKAADLTRQLLAFSRKQVLDMQVVYLNDVIADMEKLLQRLIVEDVRLETVLDPAAGKVRADLVQIQQILMNLALNAQDAMPEGGNLTIETCNSYLDEEYARLHPEVHPGEYVMFSVSDDGQGMDAKTMARVFEPFFTTKEKGVGTGLGLAGVYGIVKQHQGHVNVYSELGRGTTFRVYLPRSEAAPDAIAPACAPGPRPAGDETILIVEDEEIVRNLACEALEILGYRTLSAADPREAIMIGNTHEGRIHLLLTDVVLPHMDGRRLYDALAMHRPDLKVLYVSGYTENFIVHHGVLDKNLHFMHKPFNLDSLARKVRTILDEA